MTVLAFKRPEPEVPHLEGKAFCIGCGHEWEAAAPVGTTELECPACHALKGHFRCECLPTEGLLRECGCGCVLFYITPEGHMCANCGVFQVY